MTVEERVKVAKEFINENQDLIKRDEDCQQQMYLSAISAKEDTYPESLKEMLRLELQLYILRMKTYKEYNILFSDLRRKR